MGTAEQPVKYAIGGRSGRRRRPSIGELSMEIELLRERACASERRLPLATRRSRR